MNDHPSDRRRITFGGSQKRSVSSDLRPCFRAFVCPVHLILQSSSRQPQLHDKLYKVYDVIFKLSG